jgi:hypothetical protein
MFRLEVVFSFNPTVLVIYSASFLFESQPELAILSEAAI